MAEVRRIASRSNPLLMRLRKLVADPGGYRKAGEIWIEGEHLCAACLQHAGMPSQALITEAAYELPALRRLALGATAVGVVPEALMRELGTLESPAALGFVVPWMGGAQAVPGRASVVLDRLQDPGNVGTVLRSAAAFGFHQVLAIKGTAALWSPKVMRAGMGAHFGLQLIEGIDEAALAVLELPWLATSPHAPQALHEASLPWPCAWVLGHEGSGVSASLLRRCTQALRIPQPGGEESLNVAAAAAVCFYESARQRLFPSPRATKGPLRGPWGG